MKYYSDSLYVWGDNQSLYTPLYKYDLNSGEWVKILPTGKQVEFMYNNGMCIYKDFLYSVLGLWQSSNYIHKINLAFGNYELEEIFIDRMGLGNSWYGYFCNDNLMYLFGGADASGKFNTLSLLDFDQYPLKFQTISKNMKTPTARSGHGMEVFDNVLYIYGGMTNGGTQ